MGRSGSGCSRPPSSGPRWRRSARTAPGLAAGVNNAARQAGGAIGIAAFGAVAGSPARTGFVDGFHAVALGAATLYVAAAALAWAAIPSR